MTVSVNVSLRNIKKSITFINIRKTLIKNRANRFYRNNLFLQKAKKTIIKCIYITLKGETDLLRIFKCFYILFYFPKAVILPKLYIE